MKISNRPFGPVMSIGFLSIAMLLLVAALSSKAEAQEQPDPRREALMGTYSSTPSIPSATGAPTYSFRSNTGSGPVVLFPTPSGYPVDWGTLRAQRLAEAASQAARKINFEFDSAELEEGIQEGLSDLAALLDANPDVGLTLSGHTDLVGPDGYNYDLGDRRAEAVRSGLLDHGVDPGRLRVQSFGKDSPLSLHTGRNRENRRVEIGIFDLFSQ